MSGNRALRRAFRIEDLRALARRRLPRGVFDLFDGGAEDELTLADNRAAFQRVRLRPKVLVDVSRADASTQLLGGPSALPMAIAPTGAVGFGWPHGEVALARAAQAFGIPFALSTSATSSIERIAAAVPGHRLWFQAYILKDRDFTMKLVERARAAGFEGLMITVDLPVGGKRERDFRNDFSIPFRWTPRNLRDFALRPAWVARQFASGLPVMENLIGLSAASTSTQAIASSVGRNYDPSFDWDALRRLRDAWAGKFIVKGIVRGDDAERAARLGCDAIVVSNHGGRQLDGGVATLDAMPEVIDAVGSRASVLVDGGVRRGSDVVKALAMGAAGVLVGRATLYGACAAGEAGAVRALEILSDELLRTMRLCGIRSTAEIGPDLIFRGPLGAQRESSFTG
ncbi:alpha-hydroxy-acid oxidizing protein [Burkholderiaceae bacterium FT117]|uniref:alpha-hydroxy acid oxidase n=1 Tax=Zeimonas sediminis TaxID=2944268 RepID=UPI002342EFDF|nr:alpha-hydroxy acid oxidase [Zeimonas sediminis]MCM5571362.1 alpha-hydroxy-acid oxidizing protein [Zeimonas sediminis]